jgi:hypothetical protein
MSEYIVMYRGQLPAPSEDIEQIDGSNLIHIVDMLGTVEDPTYLVKTNVALTNSHLGLDDNWIVSPNRKYQLL